VKLAAASPSAGEQVSGPELARVVQAHGWKLARIHGSHHIFTMEGRRERIVIPVHGNRPLKIGLLRALMKIAGLKESDL
jgi:predicted RNA binding protein YcfA (HicA-like mRNA interferase family)